MADFFTADTHVGHQNILKFCGNTRFQWDSVEDMADALRYGWNNVVGPNDTVYHLGDVGMRVSAKALSDCVRSLNGHKVLVVGNHDKKALKSNDFLSCLDRVTLYHELKVNKRKFVLCHYPFEAWNGSNHGSIHLHGHTHGEGRHIKNRVDVGVDGPLGHFPMSVDTIVKYMGALGRAI